ncbi:MAG: hypothetical protein IJW82_00710 [Clostridia bacterium]|nr:hypothetical protein [Clostridia bacterium]
MKKFNELINEYNDKKGKLTTLSIKKLELQELSSDVEKDNYLCSIFKNRYEEIDLMQSRLENELNKLSTRIIHRVDLLKNADTKNIVLMRIFTNKTWKYIAKTCLYSEARVRQLYKEGITSLTKN